MNLDKNIYVTDIHSHILPALDDGAKDWAQAKAMLDMAYRQGIRDIIATPHYMPDSSKGKAQKIRYKVAILQEYADRCGYDMQIYPGNEIYYHEDVTKLLDEGEILTLADSTYVLIEFSPADDVRYIRNALAEIQAARYSPIIAHAERYENLCRKPYDKIDELRQMGIMLQVNMSTIEGHMGRKMKSNAIKMLKLGLVDFLGTDAHSTGKRAPMTEKCISILKRKVPKRYLEDILFANAEEVITNTKE